MICYAGKQENPFWFSSLGQMVQFGAIIFCRTFKNYFGQFVWIEKKRKKRVTIIVAFHFIILLAPQDIIHAAKYDIPLINSYQLRESEIRFAYIEERALFCFPPPPNFFWKISENLIKIDLNTNHKALVLNLFSG